MSRCQAGTATLGLHPATLGLLPTWVTCRTPDASQVAETGGRGGAWCPTHPIATTHTVHPPPPQASPLKVQQAPGRGACRLLLRLVSDRAAPAAHTGAGPPRYSSDHLVVLDLADSAQSRVLLPATRRHPPQPCCAATWMFSRAVGRHHRPSHCSRLAASRLHSLAPPRSGRRASMAGGAVFEGGAAHVLGAALGADALGVTGAKRKPRQRRGAATTALSCTMVRHDGLGLMRGCGGARHWWQPAAATPEQAKQGSVPGYPRRRAAQPVPAHRHPACQHCTRACLSGGTGTQSNSPSAPPTPCSGRCGGCVCCPSAMPCCWLAGRWRGALLALKH